ncbi:hypothetical protein PHYBLDRAFT_59730 [Phycomyces blakesleeanus NRRL 1555(-)]|uniref:Tc1-like transposase DDE domain-containing protein n=1 Tax=Phycomyces blakesleeanus (strain ATCC 8743b / DSM 1359 / FGSC 10004 / NBRC 33097 / NRRL 1555) TaxID=763407 RepID=A0A162XQN0_PHYB8|nr:hypothetical protein PHYBLDRAFT_59730 [Phycomyces blakesleeanus NRRL 1555(-)]OAD76195.1 hypothetical protein PHYBLDRAFT_59730 [Phycomyces blakesleeanus NRRL 1555(-)]|eukprot:XP_018294235.1 hypothetical protein PHYBLDRAFT_59730 [Phycomyces blakesleeanus NRRL 1555(-)]
MDKDPHMKGHYIVMDNTPIHTNRNLKKYIEYRSYKCVYPPTYSSELNLIENFCVVAKKTSKTLESEPTTSSHMPPEFIIDLCCLTEHGRCIVKCFDVSEGFYQFQLLARKMTSIPKNLHMESHVYHVLSLSFTFLAIPGNFHNDLNKFIPNDKLVKIVNDLNT